MNRIFLWLGVAILVAAMDYAAYQLGKSAGRASCPSAVDLSGRA
jgi:hypothetical protein